MVWLCIHMWGTQPATHGSKEIRIALWWSSPLRERRVTQPRPGWTCFDAQRIWVTYTFPVPDGRIPKKNTMVFNMSRFPAFLVKRGYTCMLVVHAVGSNYHQKPTMIIKEQGSSACALQCLRRWGCRSWDCLLVETSEGSRNLVKSQIVKNWWDPMNVRFHKPTNPEKNDTSTERPCLEHNNIILKWSSIICKPCKHKRCGPRSALADAFLWHCPFRTNKLSLEIKWIRRTWSLKSLNQYFPICPAK